MCDFISATFSGQVSLDEINSAAALSRLRFELSDGDPSTIPNEDRFLRKWTPHCDCGTRIGSLACHPSPDHDDAMLLRLAEELKRKHWGERKIERWLSAKRKDLEKDARVRTALATGSAEIDEWLTFIDRLFATTRADSFGVMRHWGNRRVRAKETLTIATTELSGDHLMRLRDSCLLRITR